MRLERRFVRGVNQQIRHLEGRGERPFGHRVDDQNVSAWFPAENRHDGSVGHARIDAQQDQSVRFSWSAHRWSTLHSTAERVNPESRYSRAVTAKDDRRAKIEELLGDMFDQADSRQPRDMTIGEQAEKARRRKRFQELGVELARELAKAMRPKR